jgi:hypothetical protein
MNRMVAFSIPSDTATEEYCSQVQHYRAVGEGLAENATLLHAPELHNRGRGLNQIYKGEADVDLT